jgi:transposase
VVTIGIDPHQRSLTAAALDPHSRLLGQLRVPASSLAATHLLAWAAAWPQRRWAVEGASGLGRGIAQLLVAAGEPVLDVPAKLAARARLLGSSSARKSDLADACSVAAAALHHRQLRPVVLEDQTMVLRLLSDRRDDLVAERTRTLSRLHVLLADLQPGGANRELTATRAAALLRQIHHHGGRRRGQADRSPVAGRRAPPGPAGQDGQPGIRQAVREHGTTLTQVFGVGPVLAAKLLGHAGDLTRFPSRDHFASYSGTAPIEASSGDVRRHRLNRGGNRQLNTALHLIAVCQIRDPSPGQAYYRRKLAQAKTPAEARRSLKRHLSNVVYSHLVTDHRHRTRGC